MMISTSHVIVGVGPGVLEAEGVEDQERRKGREVGRDRGDVGVPAAVGCAEERFLQRAVDDVLGGGVFVVAVLDGAERVGPREEVARPFEGAAERGLDADQEKEKPQHVRGVQTHGERRRERREKISSEDDLGFAVREVAARGLVEVDRVPPARFRLGVVAERDDEALVALRGLGRPYGELRHAETADDDVPDAHHRYRLALGPRHTVWLRVGGHAFRRHETQAPQRRGDFEQRATFFLVLV
mmetsp:Transcript_23445/g.72114  ORF Transcript_23445/g.72114 Transcript_23445/m.72114 type:complete len:242 (-) Transcript_23445:674-1399(-)